jgi:hypothetical protein
MARGLAGQKKESKGSDDRKLWKSSSFSEESVVSKGEIFYDQQRVGNADWKNRAD